MAGTTTGTVTQLLQDWSAGDPAALEELVPLVYSEMRQLARRAMRHERQDHTLEPTALVHEAFLSLTGQARTQWKNRSQFFALTTLLMRRVTVHHAIRHNAAKRGGSGAIRVPFEDSRIPTQMTSREILALHDALLTLETLDPRQARVVELRFFGGLTVEETARELSVSKATVHREWRCARAWLHLQLAAPPAPPPPTTMLAANDPNSNSPQVHSQNSL